MRQDTLREAPIESEAQDSLGRSGFAANVTRIALGVAGAASVRVGVFGRWGDGKTSILSLVACQVQAAGGTAIWFNPWPADSAADLRARLVITLAERLGIPTAPVKRARLLARGTTVARGVGSGFNSHVQRTDAILGSLIQSFADEAAFASAEKLIRPIANASTGRNVVVLVDDLDRVRPELLPDFLMLLREGLDFPGLSFVMGLDPDIVHAGLERVHPGWGERESFLEKIVEYPLYVPPISKRQFERFVTVECEAVGTAIAPESLSAVLPLVPPHPRKAKLFLRLLTTFEGFLSRFTELELRRAPFAVAQLLTAEFPKAIHDMVGDPGAMKALDLAAVLKQSDGLRKEASPLDALGAYREASGSPARFTQLVEALMDETTIVDELAASRYLTIVNDPPVVTSKELDECAEQFRVAPDTKRREVLRAFVFSQNQEDGNARLEMTWRVLVDAEVASFEDAVERNTTAEVETALTKAHLALDMLYVLVAELDVFGDAALGHTAWLQAYLAFRKYSKWDKPPYYAAIREREAFVLTAAGNAMRHDERRELAEELFRRSFYSDTEDVSNTILAITERLFDETKLEYATALVQQFAATEEGAVPKGRDGSLAKWLWYSAGSPIHNPPLAAVLIEALDAHSGQLPLARNAYQYFESLVYHADSGRGHADDAGKVLSRGRLAQHLWGAATSVVLNPRMMGSLAQSRAGLVERHGYSAEDFPIPEWAAYVLAAKSTEETSVAC